MGVRIRGATLAAERPIATPLVLVVHGRAGGAVPMELENLAADLRLRRQAPVLLQALTAAQPPPSDSLGTGIRTVVPLMLLPGAHVRHDLPAIANHWRSCGPIRRVPFVGAWPVWQRALAAELDQGGEPVLLHHPLQGGLAERYLHHLAAFTGSTLMPASYSDPSSASDLAAPHREHRGPVLALALAANRLTDGLGPLVGAPLLQRPRFYRVLIEQLEALP